MGSHCRKCLAPAPASKLSNITSVASAPELNFLSAAPAPAPALKNKVDKDLLQFYTQTIRVKEFFVNDRIAVNYMSCEHKRCKLDQW